MTRDMRKALWTVYFHLHSNDKEALHEFCPEGPNYWYKYQKNVLECCEGALKFKNKLLMVVMDSIKPIFNDLSQLKLLHKYLEGKTQNNKSIDMEIMPENIGL
ncbi:hypothetical protein NPIL_642431 [Nephila pilipes]|uniref:Uncharacterized protein n=1 Tax=Nephila pilipes TaxID=299642 RepID=A0A8X6P2J1_NEPPI|nr:hypothetical protein NPIL_642431 [Nephila pilipes]